MNVKGIKSNKNSYNSTGENGMDDVFEEKEYKFGQVTIKVTGEYVFTNKKVVKNILNILHTEKEVEQLCSEWQFHK